MEENNEKEQIDKTLVDETVRLLCYGPSEDGQRLVLCIISNGEHIRLKLTKKEVVGISQWLTFVD